MSTTNQAINRLIEDKHVMESRQEAQDLDWQARNEHRARRQPRSRPPESYTLPVTRAAARRAANALKPAQAGPTEAGSSVSDPSISPPETGSLEPTDRPAICERCFLRKQKNPDHECVKTTGTRRKACEWCRQTRQACRQMPAEFNEPVNAALQLSGHDQEQAIADIRRRL